MTYNSRPTYGIKQSFYGPAAYAEAQYQQAASGKPEKAQALAVGDSSKNTIEGFEKSIYPQPGTKQELMGAGVVCVAEAAQVFAANATAPAEDDNEEEEEPKKDDAVVENN